MLQAVHTVILKPGKAPPPKPPNTVDVSRRRPNSDLVPQVLQFGMVQGAAHEEGWGGGREGREQFTNHTAWLVARKMHEAERASRPPPT